MISEKNGLVEELGEAQAVFTLAALMPMAVAEHRDIDTEEELMGNPLLHKAYYDDLRASLKAIAHRMITVADEDKRFVRRAGCYRCCPQPC